MRRRGSAAALLTAHLGEINQIGSVGWTIEVYTRHVGLPREVSLDEMMTNEFNPKLKPPRR